MSGPICPDCNCLALTYGAQGGLTCPICGFVGKDLPRKIMMPKMQSELSKKTQSYLQLRKEGKLFFVRVFTKGSAKQKDAVVNKLFDIFELKGLSTGGSVLVVPVSTRPSDAIIADLKAMSGVKDITVF